VSDTDALQSANLMDRLTCRLQGWHSKSGHSFASYSHCIVVVTFGLRRHKTGCAGRF